MRKAILVLSAFFLLAGVVSAQTVDEIIAKNLDAKGGLAKIKAVQSMRLTGHAEFGAMQAKAKGHKVELIGKEKTEGTDTYHLRVTLKNGNVRDLFIDADSFLEIKAIGKTTRRGTETIVESSLGDYKEVQGMMVPFSIEQHPQGMQGQGQKITLEKVEFNVPVDDAIFKMPAPAPPAPEVKKP